MREILDDIERWRAAGKPRRAGPGGRHRGLRPPRLRAPPWPSTTTARSRGSVSGGCVEGAVVTEALDDPETGDAASVSRSATADDDAFAVGLTCGGTIHLFIEPLDW